MTSLSGNCTSCTHLEIETTNHEPPTTNPSTLGAVRRMEEKQVFIHCLFSFYSKRPRIHNSLVPTRLLFHRPYWRTLQRELSALKADSLPTEEIFIDSTTISVRRGRGVRDMALISEKSGWLPILDASCCRDTQYVVWCRCDLPQAVRDFWFPVPHLPSSLLFRRRVVAHNIFMIHAFAALVRPASAPNKGSLDRSFATKRLISTTNKHNDLVGFVKKRAENYKKIPPTPQHHGRFYKNWLTIFPTWDFRHL